MKAEIPLLRYFLLAWLCIVIAGCMLVPFVSHETVLQMSSAFHMMVRVAFFFCMAMLAVYCFQGTGGYSEVNCSRRRVQKAHHKLYEWVERNAIEKGYRDAIFSVLYQQFLRTLEQHLREFPEDADNEQVNYYLTYHRRIEVLRQPREW